MTDDEADEVYNDGRYVGKDQLGDAAYCDVYNALDETSAGKVHMTDGSSLTIIRWCSYCEITLHRQLSEMQ